MERGPLAGRARGDGPHNEEADLALEVSDLAGPYLGGFTFRELQRAGRVVELRDGAVARADKLFRSDVAPWCPEIF